MTNPLLALMPLATAAARTTFIRKTRRVMETQEQFLLTLLKAHQNTVLGQAMGLSDIKTVEQFREQVPSLPYSDYLPYLDRMMEGETNLLTPDPLIYVNFTSGSTGNRKMVPVTARSRQMVRKANQVAMGFGSVAAQQQGLSFDKLLITTSARVIGQTSSGVDYGHISGGSLKMNRFVSRLLFAQPYEALLVDDTPSRIYLCLLFALRNPQLGMIGETFPVLILRLCDYLEQFAEQLIKDMAKGTIADWLELEPAMRSTLERQWSAAPHRATELRQILKREGRLTPRSAWANLGFLITAKGGTSEFYFERFPDYFGDTPIFGGTYASSEATFGVHHRFDSEGAILAIESGFFEFVPIDQWDTDSPKTLLPPEVEVGQYYRIWVTNYAGFYRYDIGDVVQVVGFYEQAPLVVFRHRSGGIMSAMTEKTTEHHVMQVIRGLHQEFNVTLKDFCVTLSERLVSAYYVLNIELAEGEILPNPQAFLASFDRYLQEANSSYQVKRIHGDIPAPHLRVLAPGSFDALQRRSQPATAQSQMKFPHISEDRSFLNGLVVKQEIELENAQNCASSRQWQ